VIEELIHGSLLAENERLKKRVEELEAEVVMLSEVCTGLREENDALLRPHIGDYF
jgi:hypothetical protein